MITRGAHIKLIIPIYHYVRKEFIPPGTQGIVLGVNEDSNNKREHLVKFKGYAFPTVAGENQIKEIK